MACRAERQSATMFTQNFLPGGNSNRSRMRPAQIIPLSFLVAIAAGTLLLLLPFSTAAGEHTDFLTALFTATTSVCVTGLVVVDTYAHWSLFGQVVILLLIQLGGLGIIAVTSALMLLLHKKFSLRNTLLIHDAFNLNSMSDLLGMLKRILLGTFLVEGAGAVLYMFTFLPRFGVIRGIWYSVFTAISAFCNAGIDVLGPDSLISWQSSPAILIPTMLLIILGGLGYVVWFDIVTCVRSGIRRRFGIRQIYRRLGEHTRLVLNLTLFLIVSGAVLVFIFENANPDTIGGMSAGGKILNSLFQSVTFRTAGFAAVPQQNLTQASCVLGGLLMFIGGSPVGTAGGVKTVTMAVVILNAVSFIRARDEVVVQRRRVDNSLIQKAAAIVAVSFSVTFLLLLCLLATNPVSLTDGMFEMVSATATVGLSRALTPALNTAGRILIVLAMYLGRIGPISMALFFSGTWSDKNLVSYAKGNYFVG